MTESPRVLAFGRDSSRVCSPKHRVEQVAIGDMLAVDVFFDLRCTLKHWNHLTFLEVLLACFTRECFAKKSGSIFLLYFDNQNNPDQSLKTVQTNKKEMREVWWILSGACKQYSRFNDVSPKSVKKKHIEISWISYPKPPKRGNRTPKNHGIAPWFWGLMSLTFWRMSFFWRRYKYGYGWQGNGKILCSWLANSSLTCCWVKATEAQPFAAVNLSRFLKLQPVLSFLFTFCYCWKQYGAWTCQNMERFLEKTHADRDCQISKARTAAAQRPPWAAWQQCARGNPCAENT